MSLILIRTNADKQAKIDALKAEAAEIGSIASIQSAIKAVKKNSDGVTRYELNMKKMRLEHSLEKLKLIHQDIDKLTDVLTYDQYRAASPQKQEQFKTIAESVILSKDLYEKWQFIAVHAELLRQIQVMPDGAMKALENMTNYFDDLSKDIQIIMSEKFFHDFETLHALEQAIQDTRDKIEAIDDTEKLTQADVAKKAKLTSQLEIFLTELSRYQYKSSEIIERAQQKKQKIIDVISNFTITNSINEVKGEGQSFFEEMFRQGNIRTPDVEAINEFKKQVQVNLIRNDPKIMLSFISDYEASLKHRGLNRASIIVRQFEIAYLQSIRQEFTEEELGKAAQQKAKDYEKHMQVKETESTPSTQTPVPVLGFARRVISKFVALFRKESAPKIASQTLHIYKDLASGEVHSSKSTKEKVEKSIKGTLLPDRVQPQIGDSNKHPEKHVVLFHPRKAVIAKKSKDDDEGEGDILHGDKKIHH